MRVEELRRLAEANGVSSRFRLANGRWNRVRPETLEAVLAAMGVEPGVPATGGADPGAPATPSGAPVLVARRGREAGWALPAGSLLVLESGEERAPPARLPGDLPLGRHRLVHPGGERRLVVAPEACHLPDRLAGGGRARGWAAQLYALRSRRSWGIGDLGDLARLAGGPDLADFERWRATAADLEEFAGFCALQRERPGDWHAWPAELRHPGSPAVAAWRAANPGEVGYHAYLQWLLDEQLRAAARRAGGAGRAGVVNDLAVGFDPGGFDAWWMRDLLAPGVTVGAPPDLLGPYGQDWALPAFVPGRLAEAGYEPFARTLRAGMAHAGGLRLDHVMGLFRLFWIPPGASPSEGTYVRYPADDLLGVLALESHRARALVIGEDLGTVQEGVRERLATERVLSYRLVWFERERGRRRRAARYPRLALAAVTTHDLPTAAGWLRGDDLRELAAIGVVPPDQLAARAEAQEAERAELFRLLEAEGVLEEGERSVDEVVAALYAFLARTPAMLVAATLEDAVLSSERPNVPGTTTERPNWRIPLPVLLEDLWDLPSFRRLVAATKRQ